MKLTAIPSVLAAILLLGTGAELAEAAKKKSGATVRDRMTSEQKAKLRKEAFAYCSKKFGRVHHVEIKSDGRAYC